MQGAATAERGRRMVGGGSGLVADLGLARGGAADKFCELARGQAAEKEIVQPVWESEW